MSSNFPTTAIQGDTLAEALALFPPTTGALLDAIDHGLATGQVITFEQWAADNGFTQTAD